MIDATLSGRIAILDGQVRKLVAYCTPMIEQVRRVYIHTQDRHGKCRVSFEARAKPDEKPITDFWLSSQYSDWVPYQELPDEDKIRLSLHIPDLVDKLEKRHAEWVKRHTLKLIDADNALLRISMIKGIQESKSETTTPESSKMSTVFIAQAKKPTFGFGTPPSYPDGFELVASVDVPDDYSETGMLAAAFEMTNTIDRPWWENEGVTKLFSAEGCRSTSVGDMIVLPDKRVFAVANFGFNLMEDADGNVIATTTETN